MNRPNGPFLRRLLGSAATFQRDTADKLAFLLCNYLDLGLTLWAVSQGLNEANPLMRVALGDPLLYLLVKSVLPVFIAWLIPGKLLWPASLLLLLVVGWNVKELILARI